MSQHKHNHSSVHIGSSKTLLFALSLTIAFAVIEIIGGVLANSLALLSDAGHMLTDSLSLAVGAVAAWLASKPSSSKHTFGLQRAEVLGALFNVLFMFAVIGVIAIEAVSRFNDPPEVAGLTVVVIGSIGLLVNLLVAWVLMRGEQSINVRGALLHVMGDLLGSVAAVAAGLVIYMSGWMLIDPLLSLFVCALILFSASRLLLEVIHILMEAVPGNIDPQQVTAALVQIDGVTAVHDMHIWSLSSDSHALAAHIEVQQMQQWQAVLPRLQIVLREQFNILHTTLQPEDADISAECDSVSDCCSL